MAVGIGTAILLAVGAGASAGASIYGAHEAASANQHAADTQTAAANHAADVSAKASEDATAAQLQAAEDALNYQKQARADTQARLAPYQQWGASALGALGTGLGLHMAPPAVPPPTDPTATGSSPASGPPAKVTIFGANGAPTTVSNTPTNPAPQGPTLGNLGMPTPQPQPQQQAQAQTQSSVRPAQIGEQRVIQGQNAVWDGQGWKAV